MIDTNNTPGSAVNTAPTLLTCVQPIPKARRSDEYLEPVQTSYQAIALPEIENAEFFLNAELQIPDEIISGILHAGSKMVLGSNSKAGKTWMMLDLATSVATGQPWIGYPTVQGRVLFINFEIQRAFIQRRIDTLRMKKQLEDLSGLDIWNLRGHAIQFSGLVDRLLKNGPLENPYSMIVLDPIYKAMAGGDESTFGTVGTLCNELERLGHRTGAAVVFAHHFPKGNQSKKSPIDRLSGSGVFARDADTIVTMTEQETDNCYAVEFTLRNFKAQPAIVVGWEFPQLVKRGNLDPAKLKGKGGRKPETSLDDIVDLLVEQPLSASKWREAAELSGVSPATFYRRKTQIVAKGLASENNDGTWRAMAGGGEAAGEADEATSPPPPCLPSLPVEVLARAA